MSGYTPLFQSIVTSSIWNEATTTRIVWITILALADSQGRVEGSVAGLAPVARVTIDECIAAIKVLGSPDEYSRTKDYDGRRIHEIEGGWQIYNFKLFRDRAKSRAVYMRQYRQEKKKVIEEEKTLNPNPNPNPNKVTKPNTTVTGVTVTQKREETLKQCAIDEFECRFWPNVPNKIGKGKAREAYLKARKKVSAETILSALPKYQIYEDGRKSQIDYRPLHPATWLNQERWDDEIKQGSENGRNTQDRRSSGQDEIFIR